MSQKNEKIKQFAEFGVEEKQIFREIMRARHLDNVLFREPKYRDYGVTQEQLAQAAEAMTAEKFGAVPQPYAYVYSLAMSVDPMLFADGAEPVSPAMAAVVDHAAEAALHAENAVLFAGAEQYVKKLTDIFVTLKGRRIDIAVADPVWQEPVAMIFDRGRSLMAEDLYDDTEKYDFIFYAGNPSESSAVLWKRLQDRLVSGGTFMALMPDSLIRSGSETVLSAEKKLCDSYAVSSMYHVADGRTERILITSGGSDPEGRVLIGEADMENGFRGMDKTALSRRDFQTNNIWDYDVYAYNSSPAVQTVLAAGVLDPDFAVGSVFREVQPMKGTAGTYSVIRGDAVTDSSVREDLVKQEPAADVARVCAGDLVMAVSGGRPVLAVVPASMEGAAAAGDVTVFRPLAEYTAEYLKAYLDGPVGQLFLDTMKTGHTCHVTPQRLLRLPLRRAGEAVIGAVTAQVRESTAVLARAEAAWRDVKQGAVGLMMGQHQ